MAPATYVEGVRAGAGAIDCAISSVSGFSSQPPVETQATIFKETNYSAELDFDALEKISKYFAELTPKRQTTRGPQFAIDPNILIHQIPGGMISNFRSQLKTQNALDKLPDALKEVTIVRKDLGYPPLVTPTSQIVGTQAVMNVISGERYKIVPNEVRNYVKGMYGKSPVPIDKEIIKKILGDEKPITSRPADSLEPMLPKATEGLNPKFIEYEEDIISYCIFPEPSLAYFEWRSLPHEKRPETPADIEEKKEREEYHSTEVTEQVKLGTNNLGEPQKMIHSDDYKGLAELLKALPNIPMNEVSINKNDFNLSIRVSQPGGAPQVSQPATPAKQVAQPEVKAASTPPAESKPTSPEPATAADFEYTINSPLVGTFYDKPDPSKPAYVKDGDSVQKGDKVCIVEAMKLFNEIEAPFDCKIVKILMKDGENVNKDQPLIAVEKL
jgi:oxaloacetate decarboxylase (Na+ extruding) subunit alpha